MDVKKIQLFIIAVWICFTLAACGGGSSNTANTTASVIVFSDVHFNPFYDPSLFSQLAAADAGQWASVFQTSTISAPSVWGADTNYPLLALALESIRRNLGASPLIVFTGDIIGHNFPKTFFELYYGNLGVPVPDDATIEADVAAVAAMKAFADKTVAFFAANAKQHLYREHYFSAHNYSIPITGTFNPITDKTWPVYWCGIGHMDEQSLIECVNSY